MNVTLVNERYVDGAGYTGTINGMNGSGSTTGIMTLNNSGIVTITSPGMEPTQQATMHCSMDSGKSIIACTSNKANGGNANYYLFAKRGSNDTANDLTGVWNVNGLNAPTAGWNRGMIRFAVDSTFAVNLSASDGSTKSDTGTWSIISDGKVTIGGSMQCNLDSGKSFMACVASDSTRANAEIYTLVRGCTNKPGDCDGSGVISISEVQAAINMYLGLMKVSTCVDTDGNGTVSIFEVQKVINGYLGLYDIIIK
jgi:hypothetical protein